MSTTQLVHLEHAGEIAWTRRGAPAYRRISLAMFLAGFATFSLLYCVQPLLPEFARDFHVGPAQASLALSLTTGFLAIAILCAGAVSEMLGRRRLMFASLAVAAILNMAGAVAPGWQSLLVARALEGCVLGGVPAVAMAYLAEEIHPGGLGFSMGLYVGGTAFGGMFGRVAVGALTEFTSWRVALGSVGLLDLAAAIGFVALLPESRNFARRPELRLRSHAAAWYSHLRRSEMVRLFVIGFLLMGAFVTVYNYATFRLTAAPYALSDSSVSLIFLVYLFAMVASSMAGGLSDRLGRGPVLVAGIVIAGIGLGLTLLPTLGAVICGIAMLTIGFFVGHAVASGWVASAAEGAKGHASSLYLLAFYLGSSIMGSIGGWFWSVGRWPAVTGFGAALLVLALAISLSLQRSRSL